MKVPTISRNEKYENYEAISSSNEQNNENVTLQDVMFVKM